MDIERKMFGNTSLADLLSQIHTNTRIKNRTIESRIQEMSKLTSTVNDLVIVAPIIREYLDIAVKNDQHLIKLAEVVHKFMVAENKTTNPTDADLPAWELSDDEKQQLIEEMDTALDEAKETLNKPLPGDDDSDGGDV